MERKVKRYKAMKVTEVVTINKWWTKTTLLAIGMFGACSYLTAPAIPSSNECQSEVEHIVEAEQPQWSEEDLHAIVKALVGECYDDKELDKRRVCEVILNRVSNSNFADTILGVLTTPAAFSGYWRQSRPSSANDYAVAKQALQDWYAGGCKPLSELLFFSAGPNRENVFRSKF